jgi:hypothetical protein
MPGFLANRFQGMLGELPSPCLTQISRPTYWQLGRYAGLRACGRGKVGRP